jgi:hypothetical protein
MHTLLLPVIAMFLSLGDVQTETDFSKVINTAVGTSDWKVFAIDTWDRGPIGLVNVEEVRQQNPPSLWAVTVKNRGTAVTTFRMAAAVVTGDHKVKGIQQMQVIKNLEPGKEFRQQIKIFPTIMNPTDRVVFHLSEVTTGSELFKADKDTVDRMIAAVAARHPVQ